MSCVLRIRTPGRRRSTRGRSGAGGPPHLRRRTVPALLRTAYLLTGSRADAEDLLQTALAKPYLSWDRICDRQTVDAYVRRITVNTQTSWWRRRKRDEHPTDELPEPGGGRDASADLDLHDALWTALSALPKRQRAMVVLRYYEDLSEAETAQVMGVCVGSLWSSWGSGTVETIAREYAVQHGVPESSVELTPLWGQLYEPSGQAELVFLASVDGVARWGVAQGGEAGPEFPVEEALPSPALALPAALPGDEGIGRLIVVAAPEVGDIPYGPDDASQFAPMTEIADGVGDHLAGG